MKKNYTQSEVLIIGAGFIGQIMALMLASSKITVTLVDKNNFEKSDKRTTAISQGSSRIFKNLGIWKQLKNKTEGINKIFVSDQDSQDYLKFDSSVLNEGKLGFIIENQYFRKILKKEISQSKYISTFEKNEITNIYENKKENASKVFAESRDKIVVSDLIIAADGRTSATRKLLNLKYHETIYEQNAYVFNIFHEEKHNGVALEKFFPEGPLAILPMKALLKPYQNRSSVVWTVDQKLGDLTKITKKEFLAEFSKRYDNFFGKLIKSSKPSVYPLNLIYAYDTITEKVVLVGDAAQGIHPIAGQGFNLGLRDCKLLHNIILDAKLTGQKFNCLNLLKRYQNIRSIDRSLFIEATDKLNKIFSNNSQSLKIIRKFGMRFINKSDFIKNQLMKNAMGLQDLNIPYLT